MAVSVARRHVEQNKINFVIGPICPAVAIDAAAIYAKAGRDPAAAALIERIRKVE